jgi:hypothetical protein
MSTVRVSVPLAMPATGVSGSRVRFRAAHMADDTASVAPAYGQIIQECCPWARYSMDVYQNALRLPTLPDRDRGA